MLPQRQTNITGKIKSIKLDIQSFKSKQFSGSDSVITQLIFSGGWDYSLVATTQDAYDLNLLITFTPDNIFSDSGVVLNMQTLMEYFDGYNTYPIDVSVIRNKIDPVTRKQTWQIAYSEYLYIDNYLKFKFYFSGVDTGTFTVTDMV